MTDPNNRPSPYEIPVAPAEEVGSAALAAALAARDVAAIGQALRHDVVVVPLMTLPDGTTQDRVFEPPAGAQRPYELYVFSSTATLAQFLQGSPERGFALRRGTALAPFLESYRTVLERVVFDPAGPYPMEASVDDVLRVLQPRPGDDEVAWATAAASLGAPSGDVSGQPTATGRTPGPADRAVAFDLVLPDDWFVLDLADPVARSRQVRELARRQTKVLGDRGARLRADLRSWLDETSGRAATAGGRLQAYLLQRSKDAAAAVSLTLYWHELGPAIGATSHLDRVVDDIRGRLGADDELVGAETPAGPFARHTYLATGPAGLDTRPRPVLVLDYWLQMPGGRGVVQISVSTPHVDAREQVALLADNIVLRGAWLMAGDAGH